MSLGNSKVVKPKVRYKINEAGVLQQDPSCFESSSLEKFAAESKIASGSIKLIAGFTMQLTEEVPWPKLVYACNLDLHIYKGTYQDHGFLKMKLSTFTNFCDFVSHVTILQKFKHEKSITISDRDFKILCTVSGQVRSLLEKYRDEFTSYEKIHTALINATRSKKFF